MASLGRIINVTGLALLGLGAFAVGGAWTHPHGAVSAAKAPLAIRPSEWNPPSQPPPTEPTRWIPSSGLSANGSMDAGSYNWAGLIQAGSHETSVQASWQAPEFTGPGQPQSAIAEWIGLGGVSSSQLIQVGTMTSPTTNGTPQTVAFWEQLPHAAVQTVSVPTGATVNASIVPAGYDQWRLLLSVKGQSQPVVDQVVTLTPEQAAGIQTSADWITEVPTANGSITPLAPVAQTVMTQVAANGIALSAMDPGTLQTIGLFGKQGQILAEPVAGVGQSNQLTVRTVYDTGGSSPAWSIRPWRLREHRPGWRHPSFYPGGHEWVKAWTTQG